MRRGTSMRQVREKQQLRSFYPFNRQLPGPFDRTSNPRAAQSTATLSRMVIEVVILNVRWGRSDGFEAAFLEAHRLISAMPRLQRHKLRRCVETPDRYLSLVWWESLASHTEGFRKSPGIRTLAAALHHFYDPSPEVEHYNLVVERAF